MDHEAEPPDFFGSLLRSVIPRKEHDRLIGELEEEYYECICPQRGVLRAKIWYWKEGLSLLMTYAVLRLKRHAIRDVSVILNARRSRRYSGEPESRIDCGLIGRLLSDARIVGRTICRRPLLTIVMVITLATGIGATSAAFSFISSFLFPLPPASRPDRLVRVFANFEGLLEYGMLSYPEYLDLRDQNDVFSDLITDTPILVDLDTGRQRDREWVSVVSDNFFTGLGVALLWGGGELTERSNSTGGDAVAVISYRLWNDRFGSSPDAIGKSVKINGHPFTIIGVAPRTFEGINPGYFPSLWAPLSSRHVLLPSKDYVDLRGARWLLFTAGRLKGGVTIEQAQADCNAILDRLGDRYPDIYRKYGQRYLLLPELRAGLHPAVKDPLGRKLWLLFGIGCLFLLITGVNAACLFYSRLRQCIHEIGIKMAIGANHTELGTLWIMETVAISILAGGLGLLIGYSLLQLASRIPIPFEAPIHLYAHLDTRAVLFTISISLLIGVLCGLLPTLFTSRRDILPALQDGDSKRNLRGLPVKRVLLVTQFSLSAMLLMICCTVLHYFHDANRADPGFDPDNQLIASVDLDLQGYSPEEGNEFISTLKENISKLPGVESIGASQSLPLSLRTNQTTIRPVEFNPPKGFRFPEADYNIVDSGFFTTMKIQVLRGRVFNESEAMDPESAIVINETLADIFWPDSDPVGDIVQLAIRSSTPGFKITGVVNDYRSSLVSEAPLPIVFLPRPSFYSGIVNFHIRTTGPPELISGDIDKEISALDPRLQAYRLQTMHDHMTGATIPSRMAGTGALILAMISVLLTSAGLFGVVMCSVNQGRKEIGIRLALGARPADVIKLVVKHDLLLTATGSIIGIGSGVVFCRIISGSLACVIPYDSISIAFVIALLLISSLVASCLPGVRATRINPAIAMKTE